MITEAPFTEKEIFELILKDAVRIETEVTINATFGKVLYSIEIGILTLELFEYDEENDVLKIHKPKLYRYEPM